MTVKRLNYFENQFLHAKDFNDEQAYHVGMRRRHNRTLHTPGVTEGLRVTFEPESTAVTVQPGMAVDGQGREIVLTEAVKMDFAEEPAGATLFLTVSYEEELSDPTTETGVTGKTRWEEGVQIGFSATPPTDPTAKLPIARVTRDGTRVTAVDESVRRPAGARGVVGDDLLIKTLTLKREGDMTAERPALSCSAANQAALSNASLRLDAGRDVVFQGGGQVRTADSAQGLLLDGGAQVTRIYSKGGVGVRAGGATADALTILADGKVGVGTPTPNNPLTVQGAEYTYFNVRSKNGASEMVLGAEPGTCLISTTTKHDLQIRTNGQNPRFTVKSEGNVGVGTTNPADPLEVSGAVRILTGGNPIRFTSGWTDFSPSGSKHNKAEISNDPANGLMIVGNSLADGLRRVQIWDRLVVNGELSVTGNTNFPVNGVLFSPGRLHINGGETLYLLNKSGVIVSKAWGGTGNLTVEGAIHPLGKIEGNVQFSGRIGVVGWPATPHQAGWGGGIRTWDIECHGSGWAAGGWHSGPRDLAENYYSAQDLAAGDVVCLDAEHDLVNLSSAPNDPLALGVVSTKPGVLLNSDPDVPPHPQGALAYPVALCGRVPCKVTDENGPIRRGDLLTTSSTPGHAMKALPARAAGEEFYRPGTIIGKALEPLRAGRGVIEIFVALK